MKWTFFSKYTLKALAKRPFSKISLKRTGLKGPFPKTYLKKHQWIKWSIFSKDILIFALYEMKFQKIL